MKQKTPTIFSSLTLLSLVLVLLSASGEAKVANCKTRFTKKTSNDYCTKFGVGKHT